MTRTKISYELADEHRHLDGDEAWEDRALFVWNLGILLTQCSEDVVGTRLIRNDDYEEMVDIEFIGGGHKKANVTMDSYLSIIKDVVKAI